MMDELTCPKCLQPMTEEQDNEFHGCCSQECDEDEGILIMIVLHPQTEEA